MNEGEKIELVHLKHGALELTPDVPVVTSKLFKRIERAVLSNEEVSLYPAFIDIMMLEGVYQKQSESLSFEDMKKIETFVQAGIRYALQKIESYVENLQDTTLHSVSEVPTDINYLFDASQQLQNDGMMGDTDYIELQLLRKRVYLE